MLETFLYLLEHSPLFYAPVQLYHQKREGWDNKKTWSTAVDGASTTSVFDLVLQKLGKTQARHYLLNPDLKRLWELLQ